MTLSNISGTQLAMFKLENYHQMHHLLESVNCMYALLFMHNSNVNTRDILKHWVKETLNFRMSLNHVYKMSLLRKAYQLVVIFACHLYGQDSKETFLQIWVVMLD